MEKYNLYIIHFVIPFLLGFLGGFYILHFSMLTSVLFASFFSSHTLIAYPMVSKLGISKNLSVNITVGGTMLTDVLSLLVLAVVVGMTQGEVNSAFWTRLSFIDGCIWTQPSFLFFQSSADGFSKK